MTAINTDLLRFAGCMLCFQALSSVREYTTIPVSNTLVYYAGAFSLIGVSFYMLFKNKCYAKPAYIIILIYLAYALFSIVRGILIVETYWVFNQLIRGIMATLVPVTVFLFARPENCTVMLRILNRFLAIAGLCLLYWMLHPNSYAFFIVPFFTVYICFLWDMPPKWRWLTLFFAVIILTSLNNRSGCLKCAVAFAVFSVSILPTLLRNIALNVIHWGAYGVAFVLLALGWTGYYNFFNPHMYEKSIAVTVSYADEESEEANEKLTLDTRTFIYIESLESAIDNDHLWFGRTPARGYSSPYFYKLFGKDEKAFGIDDEERHQSEVGHLNFFIWQGIVGVVMIFLIYLIGTTLALYRSRNKYVKMIAAIVAFMWAYGWIENFYRFLLLDITIYLMIAMCYSPYFRKMTDAEFRLFIRDIFLPPSAPSALRLHKVLTLLTLVRAAQKMQPKRIRQ